MGKTKNIFCLSRLGRAFIYSWQGLKACYQNEPSFRLELLVLLAATPLALLLGRTPFQKALLIVTILLIMLTELVNSAIEAIIDHFGKEEKLFGMAKDMGSAAVLLAIIIALIVWIAALFP